MRHDERARHAGAGSGERDRLAVVAGRRRDDAARAILGRQTRDQVETAAHLEGAGRVVVLVLHPDVEPQPLGQQRMAEQAASAAAPHRRALRAAADVIDRGRLHQVRRHGSSSSHSSLVVRRSSSLTLAPTSGRSVMIPSTPQPRSRRMSDSSLTVHTCSARLARWTARTNRGVTTRRRPACSGTWNARYAHAARRQAQPRSDRAPAALPSRDALVGDARLETRTASTATRLNDPTQTRSMAPARRGRPRRPPAPPPACRSLISMITGVIAVAPRHVAKRRDARSLARPHVLEIHAEAHGRVDPRQLGRRPRRDRPGRVGRAIERRVVADDDFAVGRQVDVELEAVGARGQAGVERRDRVFGPQRPSAAMREDERPIGSALSW